MPYSANQTTLLNTIYQNGPISRADLARATGLTRPTVSALVGGLIADRLVVEIGMAQSTGGKPAILLEIQADARHLVTVDLGSKMFRGALMTLRGESVVTVERSAQAAQGDQALHTLFDLIDELIALATQPLLGIGVGSPGLVDDQSGTIRQSVNLGWLDLPLKDLLMTRYDLPVVVGNDSHLAALADYLFGHTQGGTHEILIKIGEGIGAGIVINGALFHGDGGGAGEIGHVVVREEAGRLYILEELASRPAMLRRAEEISKRKVTWPEVATSSEFEPLVQDVGRDIGIMIAHLVAGLNIHQVVMAGPIVNLGDRFLQAVEQTVGRYALSRLASKTEIRFSALGSEIVLLGCAGVLLQQELGVR